MLPSEPPRSPYDLNFRVLGIPVRVHPLFWIVVLLLGLRGGQDNEPAYVFIWVGACFVSILVHEMGHAVAARAHGWDPWITLYGFGGLASYQPTYHTSRSQILISLAGPAAGFLLAALVAGAIALAQHRVYVDPAVAMYMPVLWEPLFDTWQLNALIGDLFFINIFWGLVNLLPIYPLDGGQISRELFSLSNPRDGVRQSLWLSVLTAGGLAALVLFRSSSPFLAIFFAYFAYTNYMTARQMEGYSDGSGLFR